MRRVAVLMGGISSEREISLKSGQGVLQALSEAGYSAFPLDLTHDVAELVRILNREKPDVIFNALHGKYGEDGCVQGVLNLMQIPYTHSGVMASAIAMDKSMTKKIVQGIGVTVAEERLVDRKDIISGNTLPYPYVVKPNDDGSSVGVFIVKTEAEKDKMLAAWPFDRSVLMETFIPGRELSVAVTDDGPLGVVEVVPKSGFYDFSNKYSQGGAEHIIPAPIAEKDYRAVMEQAYNVHKALGCRGVSRSDFRYDDTQKNAPARMVFLEVNTNPGMTPLSLVPDIAKVKGISYQDLVVWLVERATCDK